MKRRYGYRRITATLRSEGWTVNAKRVERIWRREGLKVPHKQPKKGRLWLNDGSCVRLRPEHPNHVWSYDFVEDRTHNGKKFRMLNIIDEFTRECLAIRIDRKLNSTAVIDVLWTYHPARWRDLLQPRRGEGLNRGVAALLQYGAAAIITRIQTTRTAGNRHARDTTRICSLICPSDSRKADHALRLKPDHPAGAGHCAAWRFPSV